jgi:tetratricopeptide (TPR) repeat protein
MKFVNTLISGISIVAVLMLGGCASKGQLPGVGEKVALKPTAQYIPKKTVEDGNELPYEASENPYLSTRSKVSKGSVLLFIEAKKAKRKNQLSVAKQKLGVITHKDDSLSGPWAMLGDIAVEEKQFEIAESHYKKAIEINEDNINAYTALATVQRMMGEFHVSQNTLAFALDLWPDFPEAHLNLGILYDVYLNQPEKAQAHMESYLYLTGYKNKQAQAWFDEVQSRTGIQASFIVDKSLDAVKKIETATLDSSAVK